MANAVPTTQGLLISARWTKVLKGFFFLNFWRPNAEDKSKRIVTLL